MLTCALIVWILQPIDWDKETLRETYLTKTECIGNLVKSKHLCIKIDKRKQLSYKEWKADNCSLSEHNWSGSD
tara:strand:+ start:284 stop:502 length:219 start_codon:yes stop_codon:yes gene_type:complete